MYTIGSWIRQFIVQENYCAIGNNISGARQKILPWYMDQSPAILTSDGFKRSNEIVRTKWPIY